MTTVPTGVLARPEDGSLIDGRGVALRRAEERPRERARQPVGAALVLARLRVVERAAVDAANRVHARKLAGVLALVDEILQRRRLVVGAALRRAEARDLRVERVWR